jgi:filamentous hemagglutinin family protein
MTVQHRSLPVPGPRPALRPLVLAMVCGLGGLLPAALSHAQVQVLPTGATVVQGQATIATQGNQMTIHNSANAVLNWQSFSIGAGQSVRFEQPSTSSQVLNRVMGRDASQIAGQLSSNGGVWLLNPYGVLFGPQSRVDVAGLVASTLNISNADWQARRFSLTGGEAAGPLVNQGQLRAGSGGHVLLLGGKPGVRNEGLIDAPGGQVLLAAGASIDLADSQTPQLGVRISAPAGEALNLGQVLASGGHISLQAAMVNQQGIVRADSLQSGPGGSVHLAASQDLTLSAGSQTSAGGDSGGRVVLQGDTTLVSGAVSVEGRQQGGGTVHVLGRQVGLLDGADVNANGHSQGGTILVGGGVQGKDASVPNARATYMAAGATVRADGGPTGDGGQIVLWADDTTRAYGSLSARAGAAGGHGGLIETSGGWLDARPRSVRTDAPRGRAGEWLLDPNDIFISDGSFFDTNISAGPNFLSTDDAAQLTLDTILSALASGSSVTVTTASAGANTEQGNITVSGNLSVSPSTSVTLTLNAARHIDLSGFSLDASSAPLNVVLNAGTGGAGGIQVSGSTIDVGGSLSFGGASLACGSAGCAPFAGATGTVDPGRGYGISISNSDLTANTITLRGASAIDGQAHGGVSITGGSVLTASVIDITGWTGSQALDDQSGVQVTGGSSLSASNRITINGTSRVSGPGGAASAAYGVELAAGTNLDVGSSFGGLSCGAGCTRPMTGGGGRASGPHALATDPTRWLTVTGSSDVVSGVPSDSILLAADVVVTDKAGVSLTGNGGPLTIKGSSSFDVLDAGNLLISGTGALTVDTTVSLPSSELVRMSNTGGISLAGSLAGSPTAMTVDAGAGTLNIGALTAPTTLDIGTAPLTLRAAVAQIGTAGGSVSVQAGPIQVQADSVTFGIGADLQSPSPGNAITVAGRSGNATTFIVSGSGDPLTTPNGRSLVYATDPTDGSNFSPGGLNYSFVQYAATAGSTSPLGAGDGVLFSLAPTVVVTGSLTGATSKEYDGTTATKVSLVGAGLTGLLPGDVFDTAPAFGTPRYASPNAGSSIPFVFGLTGGLPTVSDSFSRPVYGYRFVATRSDLFGSITPRPLTIDLLPDFDKLYDGTRTVSLEGASLSGMIPGESVVLLPGTVAFDTADVGVDKPVSGTLALGNGPGGLAANYSLAGAGLIATTADISPRPVTLSGATVADKVYDGTTAATISGGTLVGLVGTETLNVVAGVTSFDSPNAGIDKTVSGSLALTDGTGGGKVSNYILTNGSELVLKGTITPRPLTLLDPSVADKVYDGSTAAAATAGALQNLVEGESLTYTLDGQFENRAVGADKNVFTTVNLRDGAGGLAANYSVVGGGFASKASITPRTVVVQGVTANDKPYDGTTLASLSAQRIDGVVPGETLNLAALATFDSAAVGTGKSVTGTVALADGSGQASNYVLSNPGSFTGTAAIVPRGLTVVAASAADKVYDGSLSADVANFALSGALPGEQVSVAAGSGQFATADVGIAKLVSATATALAGADAGNYTLASPTVQTQASITPATLTYVADTVNAPLAQPLPLPTGTVLGLVPGDTLGSATSGTLTFSTAATQYSPLGAYAVQGSGLVAPNYVFTQAPGNAVALNIIAMPTSRIGEPTSTAPTVPGLFDALQPTPAVTSVNSNRAFDALPALQYVPPNLSFRVLDLGGSDQQNLGSLLAARDRYKKAIFADAIRELENNPGAADAPACQTVEQAAAGNCLITEALKPAMRARVQLAIQAAAAGQAAAAAPAPGAQPGTAPATPAATRPAASPSEAGTTLPPTAAPAGPPTVVATAPAPTEPLVSPATAAAPIVAIAAPTLQPVVPRAPPRFQWPSVRPVRNAALPQIQRKWALLIGTDIYADKRIPQLDNAVADVDAVGRVLEDKLGYQTVVVRNGTKAAILSAFNQLVALVDPADSVAIYYAGHGELIDKIGLGFWQPADAEASRAETWLSNTDIGKLLGQVGASQVVLVSDSCFSGSLVSDERIRASGARPEASALLSHRAAVVMSSGGNEPVFDSGKNGHSTFAWSFMQALGNVPDWRPGSSIFERVRFAVARQVPQRPQYGASKLGGHESGSDYLFEQRQLDTSPQ